jgi:hypothetical protein
MNMRVFLLLATAMLGSISTLASAAVTINLSGSASKSTANLEKTNAHAVSANIGLGLGDYLSIGLTHRRSYTDNGGQKKGRNADGTAYVYIPFQERTEAITNSVDLTVIPYTGVFSPFIFGGVARRDYYNQFDYLGNRITSTQSLYPVPNYGFGVAIQLGQGFQLKITQTYSPGKETTIEDNVEKEKEVKDTYTELWLGYKI